MTTHWLHYLQQTGAQIQAHQILHFGQPEQELQQTLQGSILTDLSHFGLIQVSGHDAEKFLQGQFTHDVRQVTAEQSQLSGWCSPKGRLLVNFRLFKRYDDYYLLLPVDSLETTLKRLRMYVLRSQVQLENKSEHLLRIGLAGANSAQILTDCLGDAPPTTVNSCLTVEQTTVLQIQETPPRYVILSDNLQTLWQCMAQQARPVGISSWQLLDILAGLPHIVPAITDEFVPQMVNYQALGGISFKKGCYTGQEIVARMQYLGALKRRMYLAKIETETLPQPGEALYNNHEEQSVGQIVNASHHPEGGVVVLAVIQIDSAEQADIVWPNPQGEPLQLMTLPYNLN